MLTILPDLDRWKRESEEVALATVVRVRGSSPRKAGARMCMTRTGRISGSVSAGCLESDVVRRATEVLDRRVPAIASFSIDEAAETGVGLSCGGGIDVLIEPFADDEAWRALSAAVISGQEAVLAVVLEPERSLGRRCVLTADGIVVGEVDAAVGDYMRQEAPALLRSDGSTTIVSVMTAAGAAAVYMEAFVPPVRLCLVGANDIAMAVTKLAKLTGFHVTVIDPRPAFASRERFADADELIVEWPREVLCDMKVDERTCIVALSHDSKFDLPTLEYALRSGAAYIGALGSTKTHARRCEKLRASGFSEIELARIHSPVGLDIGGSSPAEIAVSIVAEIIAARNRRDPRASKAEADDIH